MSALYPSEYIDYLIHFHGDRDYFECHEILEEYWKKTDSRNKQSTWVGLILFAVANYHHRRRNFSGAKKALSKAITIFRENISQLDQLGIDSRKLLFDLEVNLEDLAKGCEYESYIFPFADTSLISICKDKCEQAGLIWCEKSDLSNKEIIHRHSLRDRSQVIQDRLKALQKNSNR
ncbi:DUF309 domain-containing protein [Bacillus sp. S/N-304-OC-R1]|uniref:DUF309 domain-containing protein n=1 Tax=Bacillus sp. S/N-304-OC-R1 TaxID=2758034 RepID=UPI0028BEEA73|nr:DUF309 domain-containing protein [Bacillus sp. S/N-304-OC-R1]